MAQIIVADRYHEFYPSAPTLTFSIPAYSFAGSRTLAYEYKVTASNQSLKSIDPSLTQMETLKVYVNNVLRPAAGYRFGYDVLQMIYVKPDYPYSGIPLPPIGATVRIVGESGSASIEDRFNHLDLKTVLIQGAIPFDAKTQSTHNGFQGGFRMKHIMLSAPKFGQARMCGYQTGFDYAPNVGFEGIDSFSYVVETEWGQRSDAGCISITVGSVDIAT